MQALALGIDIGGTNTSFGLVDRRGQIVVKGNMKTTGHGTVGQYIGQLKKEINGLVDKAGKADIVGVGIGAPNANYYTGEIAYAPNLPWEGVIPLAALMKDALRNKVTITNDANAAALGEMI